MDVLVVAENLPQKPFVHVFLLSYVVAMKETVRSCLFVELCCCDERKTSVWFDYVLQEYTLFQNFMT